MGPIAMNIPLKNLKYLAVDCQATGNSPKSGFLVEIGWMVFSVDAPYKKEKPVPQTLLIRPPEEFLLPARVIKLTGIRSAQLQNAVSEKHAAEMLYKQTEMVSRQNKLPLCPTVIHYARYELPFVKRLHQIHNKSGPLPFDIICTHQVASRLLPELPRKGLRAVAGYLGHSVPPLKRCAAHLQATAFIWCKMLEQLGDHAGIHTLAQLHHWLKYSMIPAAAKSYPMPRKVRLGLPDGPGIYRLKRSNNDLLYIGKATSLKQRVNSYFQSIRHHSENTLEMLTQAVDLDFAHTPTALEAALLESDAIKQFKPPYNTALTNEYRNLFFVSRNFESRSSKRDDMCRIGPVPSPELFTAAHLIGQYVIGQYSETMDIATAMAMPAKYCPERDCFQAGIALFQKKFSDLFRQRSNGQAILHIGRLSWSQQLKRKAAVSSNSDAEAPAQETPPEFSWTPDAVVKNLESVCRRCGFLIRRARWLIILSESTVSWKIRNKNSAQLNVIQFTKGLLANRFQTDIHRPIPIPPNYKEPYSERRGHMNIETYDRLRVLTTEIRRLISENRFWCIRVSKAAHLYPDQLRVLLNWI